MAMNLRKALERVEKLAGAGGQGDFAIVRMYEEDKYKLIRRNNERVSGVWYSSLAELEDVEGIGGQSSVCVITNYGGLDDCCIKS